MTEDRIYIAPDPDEPKTGTWYRADVIDKANMLTCRVVTQLERMGVAVTDERVERIRLRMLNKVVNRNDNQQ